jgi:hypothetical protein
VPLRYDPKLPFSAAIDTPVDLWLVTGVLGGLGVVFTLVGGVMFRFSGQVVRWIRRRSSR